MDRDSVEFWAKFSHEWSLYVLVSLVLSWAALLALRLASDKRPELAPAVWGARLLFYPVLAFTVYTQTHLPCASIAAARTSRLSALMEIASAQMRYAESHGGRFLTSADWQDRLKLTHLRPALAAKGERFAMNRALEGKSVDSIPEASKRVLAFVSRGPSVGGPEDVTSLRGSAQGISVAGSPVRLDGPSARWK